MFTVSSQIYGTVGVDISSYRLDKALWVLIIPVWLYLVSAVSDAFYPLEGTLAVSMTFALCLHSVNFV